MDSNSRQVDRELDGNIIPEWCLLSEVVSKPLPKILDIIEKVLAAGLRKKPIVWTDDYSLFDQSELNYPRN